MIVLHKFQEVREHDIDPTEKKRLVQRKGRKANRAPLSFLIGRHGIIGLGNRTAKGWQRQRTVARGFATEQVNRA